LLALACLTQNAAASLANQKFSWGASSSLVSSVHVTVKNQCSSAGSFFTQFQGKAICCSSSTRVPPSGGLVCPLEWDEHKTEKCCIPSQPVCSRDCGEGYSWFDNDKKCTKPSSSCSSNQWWHIRSSSCCDNSWGSSPPKGPCPGGISCPTGWFWHKDHKQCRPLHPRSPAPDCDDWDDHNRECCGGGWGNGGGQGNHGGHWKKRDLEARRQQTLDRFPVTEQDKMFCPKGLHACSIVTPHGGEWAYECVDYATELESCGGCAATGEGVDCTTIPHAMSVGCENGVCAVYTCKHGFARNGTACVA
ncbi:hypothetical protein TREMEDRAFT_17264, partial [Tremella mesenterica DSM 1558]|uniref:uncharacterized protein n=1 Tax=Tremella mesenterica (strain ATCC 24925 / CBS 8224 / DSM 1558 / NBRC 9311 / NRRL Y-6157 / RJB 2259-6 / UBC 559-6) TaxID=578456 RepID=UPI0003F4953D